MLDPTNESVDGADTLPMDESTKGFEDMNLSPELLMGLREKMKFERPSKIQSMCLPTMLTPPYKNLIAHAYKGSGKTSCFLIAMLTRVDPHLAAPQALCLCPTKDLAIQNMEMLRKMGKHTGITSELCLYDHIPVSPVSAQVIIGTSGPIYTWITAKKLCASTFKIFVFDEPDLLVAEDGLIEDYVTIMKEITTLSPRCQVLLFSPSHVDKVKDFVSTIGEGLIAQQFQEVSVKKEKLSFDHIKQYKVNVLDEPSKTMVIKDKIMTMGDKVLQTVIFVGTRKSGRELQEKLERHGYAVTMVLDALTLKELGKLIKDFDDGLIRVLITNELTQEFDLSQVNLVVNYDLPVSFKDHTKPDNKVYLRRMGRAGRFGRKGAVFNLLCGDGDAKIMENLERQFKHHVTEVSSDGDFENALKKAGLMGIGP